jgi:glycosidase
MTTRPAHPVVYEINTWIWLSELSRRYGRTITLGSVPEEQWDRLAGLGIDALWLMGVWERSPAGIRIAMQNKGLIADFKQALPDFTPEDNVGSPYCVRNYVVDMHLGGPEGLARARRMLTERKIQLILDFVPNHVAPDHPWVMEHPEYFIQGTVEDLQKGDGSFMTVGDRVFACGRDPHYPAWPDVLQLNAFHPEMRQAMIETVSDIAGQCDGIRCDMAMLMMNPVFAQTWGQRAGIQPAREFWPELIRLIRKKYPHFLFMAEAYWGLEWQLQQQGFDFCYDKRLYDRLEHGNAESVRLHLCADRSYQDRLVRFIENHDEPRAAAAFSPQRERAAAVTIATIPGARLFHEGQFEGRKVRLPVFLGRRPAESLDPDIQAFYNELLKIMNRDCLRNGEWRLCERSGWPDNTGYENLVAWCWKDDKERYLIIVNLSHTAAQGQVQLPWNDLIDRSWSLTEYFTDNIYEVNGSELLQPGLYVDLPPWGFHVFLLKGQLKI